MNHTSSRLVPVQQTCPAPARAGARMRDDAERAEVAAAAHDRQVRRRGALRPQRRDVCRAAPLARQRHPYSGLACSARGKTRSASHVTQCLCGSCSGQAAQRSDLMQLAGRSWEWVGAGAGDRTRVCLLMRQLDVHGALPRLMVLALPPRQAAFAAARPRAHPCGGCSPARQCTVRITHAWHQELRRPLAQQDVRG